MALARTGSDEALAELMRMVEGRRRRWLRRYDLQDQLVAIAALGATGRREALRYLTQLYQPTESRPIPLQRERIGREQGAEFVTTHERKTVDYPNARGKLRAALSHQVDTYYALQLQRIGFHERKVRMQTDTRRPEVHRTVTDAISRLKKSLGKAAE